MNYDPSDLVPDYRFWALATHSAEVFWQCTGLCNTGQPDRVDQKTHLSRIRWESSNSTAYQDHELATVARTEEIHLRGLSMYSSKSSYLQWDDSKWVINRGDHENWSASSPRFWPNISEVSDYLDTNTDPTLSPMKLDVRPAVWPHVTASPLKGRSNFLYLSDEGDDALSIHKAVAQRSDQTSSSRVIIGTKAPLGAQFFEVGENEVWWVNISDARVIFQNSEYGLNPTQLKYAVDLSQPILPVRDQTGGLGEAYVIYHTSGVTKGVVTAYLNENDESQFECAQ